MNQKYIISVVAAVLVVGGIVFYVNSSAPAPVAPTTQNSAINQAQNVVPAKSTTTTVMAVKPVVKPVVKAAAATITAAVLTDTITKTATSVQAGRAMTTFAPTAKNIYAVLSLKNATTRTQLSYIRNFEGKYVDSKVSHPLKTGDKQFYFGWALKAGQTRNVGNYSTTFYVDGKKAQTVTYSIR